ncbi:MAG TPA: hypothetical protein VLB01_06735, partial [Thermodesulfobacteriota bacterium]|nr:hypothetical protein [Thermodesulfobacteriota bacterium]
MGRFANLSRIFIWNRNILFAVMIALCPAVLTQTVSSQEIKTFTYSYGGRYVGQAKDGMKHGRGTMTWANGDKYVGEFKDDKKSGQGKYVWS